MKKKTKEMKGITLISLVVTIVVLLILARSNNCDFNSETTGILNKAVETKQKSQKGDATDKIKIILTEWKTEKYTGMRTLTEFLNDKKTSGDIEDILDSGDETYTIILNGYEIAIDSNGEPVGNIEKTGPRPQISNIKVVENSDGTGDSVAAKSIYEGTTLYITFQTSIEGGEISSITKDKTDVTLPYAVTESGECYRRMGII